MFVFAFYKRTKRCIDTYAYEWIIMIWIDVNYPNSRWLHVEFTWFPFPSYTARLTVYIVLRCLRSYWKVYHVHWNCVEHSFAIWFGSGAVFFSTSIFMGFFNGWNLFSQQIFTLFFFPITKKNSIEQQHISNISKNRQLIFVVTYYFIFKRMNRWRGGEIKLLIFCKQVTRSSGWTPRL